MKQTTVTTAPAFQPTDEEIQHVAYLLWIEAGRPHGCDEQHWFAARELLRHRVHSAVTHPPARQPARALVAS